MAISKVPSAVELLVINLKNSSSSAVHYACCCALAYLAVRADVRAALYEATVGPLMDTLDLMVNRLEATDHPGEAAAHPATAVLAAPLLHPACGFYRHVFEALRFCAMLRSSSCNAAECITSSVTN